MRFCTTCGRNFDNSVSECPHDGTPLFEMHGGADDEADELQSDGGAHLGGVSDDANEAAAVEAAAAQAIVGDETPAHAAFDADDEDVDTADASDDDDVLLGAPNFAEVDDSDEAPQFEPDPQLESGDLETSAGDEEDFGVSDSAEFIAEAAASEDVLQEQEGDALQEDEDLEESLFDSSDDGDAFELDSDADDADLAAELFDDEDDALDAPADADVPDADPAPSSDRIAAGIEDALGDFDDDAVEPASAPVDDVFAQNDADADVAPVALEEESKGGSGKILLFLLILLVGAGLAYHFKVGPWAEPANSDATPAAQEKASDLEKASPTPADDEAGQLDEVDPGAEDPLAAGDDADASSDDSDALQGADAAAPGEDSAEPAKPASEPAAKPAAKPSKPEPKTSAKPSAERTPTVKPDPKPKPAPKPEPKPKPAPKPETKPKPAPAPAEKPAPEKKEDTSKKSSSESKNSDGEKENTKDDGVQTELQQELDALKGE